MSEGVRRASTSTLIPSFVFTFNPISVNAAVDASEPYMLCELSVDVLSKELCRLPVADVSVSAADALLKSEWIASAS